MPHCAQCEEPGDERTLFSWLFEGVRRYLCYDTAACVARIQQQETDDEETEDS